MEKYLAAWDALGNMLASGRSLSGREHNCCFLNTGNADFADISAVSGFDFSDDTRSVTVTDWDHDGDLDVWMTNRTAPRLRFLRNRSKNSSSHNSVSIKLQGMQSNRDGIGARVELDLGSKTLIRGLRAGEGYLSQSSKWLHFGLGSLRENNRVVVRWPNGKREVFEGVAANGRYSLIEGTGKAAPNPPRKTQPSFVEFENETAAPSSDVTRIVVPARLPMPDLTYRDLDGEDISLLSSPETPLLISLWATWCQPCITELDEWSRHHQEFIKAGVRVVLLNVDEAAETDAVEPVEIRQLFERREIPFAAGFATSDLLDALDITQQVLTKRIRSLPVP